MKKLLLLTFSIILFFSCSSNKSVIYLQGIEKYNETAIPTNYEVKIKPDDHLSIIVNCSKPELAAPFNMQLSQQTFTGNTTVSLGQGGSPQVFIVKSNGTIDYPFFGEINVKDKTCAELSSHIEQLIKDNGYIQEPLVITKIMNFKISLMGEVNRPGVQNINNNRVTILEAVTNAGDLTIYGKRNKIKLLRESEGKLLTYNVDLTKADIITQPYYYLQQNDVIYVQPNKATA